MGAVRFFFCCLFVWRCREKPPRRNVFYPACRKSRCPRWTPQGQHGATSICDRRPLTPIIPFYFIFQVKTGVLFVFGASQHGPAYNPNPGDIYKAPGDRAKSDQARWKFTALSRCAYFPLVHVIAVLFTQSHTNRTLSFRTYG